MYDTVGSFNLTDYEFKSVHILFFSIPMLWLIASTGYRDTGTQ